VRGQHPPSPTSKKDRGTKGAILSLWKIRFRALYFLSSIAKRGVYNTQAANINLLETIGTSPAPPLSIPFLLYNMRSTPISLMDILPLHSTPYNRVIVARRVSVNALNLKMIRKRAGALAIGLAIRSTFPAYFYNTPSGQDVEKSSVHNSPMLSRPSFSINWPSSI